MKLWKWVAGAKKSSKRGSNVTEKIGNPWIEAMPSTLHTYSVKVFRVDKPSQVIQEDVLGLNSLTLRGLISKMFVYIIQFKEARKPFLGSA